MVLFEIPNRISFSWNKHEIWNEFAIVLKINEWEQTTSCWKSVPGVDLPCPKLGCGNQPHPLGTAWGFTFFLLFPLPQATPKSLFGTEIIWLSRNNKKQPGFVMTHVFKRFSFVQPIFWGFFSCIFLTELWSHGYLTSHLHLQEPSSCFCWFCSHVWLSEDSLCRGFVGSLFASRHFHLPEHHSAGGSWQVLTNAQHRVRSAG